MLNGNGTGNGSQGLLKDHEKFWAFIILIAAVMLLVFLASTFDRPIAGTAAVAASNDIVLQGKLRIIDSAVAGLLTITGMAAQALFRIGQGEKVTVANDNDQPIPTKDVKPEGEVTQELGEGELPPEQRVA